MREIHMIVLDLIGIHSKNTIFRAGSLGSRGIEKTTIKNHKKANATEKTSEDS